MRQTCLRHLVQLARRDPRVVFIGSDITRRDLEAFADEFPERFFLEGVYEQHLVGMAAGLALDGKVVYLNTIASFLTGRSFEQVRLDLGLHRANVRLIGSGGGVVYAPLGPTHLANDDFALLRAVPNMTIVAPADAVEMQKLMDASLDWQGPIYIRLAKGGDPVVTAPETPFQIGLGVLLHQGRDVGFVTTGILTALALEARQQLADDHIDAGSLHLHTLKPLDQDALRAFADSHQALVVAEEHGPIGGLGSAVLECLAESGHLRRIPLVRLAFPDAFLDGYGSQRSLMDAAGLNPDGLAAASRRALAAV